MMPANVGEMFYHGEVPWHGLGTKLDEPATMEVALKAGGLDWEVDTVPLRTDEDPPSPVPMRFAIVRTDIPSGSRERVLGVTHTQFKPLQNRQGLGIFDSIFGKGQKVYHTGGYLGNGEVIWALAELPASFDVAKGDKVNTYVLFTNSHNGFVAIDFRLTTIRVVCQNTLSLALKTGNMKTVFKHAHQGSYVSLKKSVEAFFEDTLKAAREVRGRFDQMVQRSFDDPQVKAYVESLFPLPVTPKDIATNARSAESYHAKVKKIHQIWATIFNLRKKGRGANLEGVQGSLWGAFNAVLEYVDHYADVRRDTFSYTMFGPGAVLKRKAYDIAVKKLDQN